MLNWLIEFAAIAILLHPLSKQATINCLANEQLKRYEIINFQTKPSNPTIQPQVNQGFLQTKGKLLLVEINAFERHFRLVALAGTQLNVRIYENGNQYATHLNESYFVGYLLDRPDASKVMGYLATQRFIGLIYEQNQIYHLDLLDDGNKVIMYRESDVIVERSKASEPVEPTDFNRLNNQVSKSKLSNLSSINQSKRQTIKRQRSTMLVNNIRFKRSFNRKRDDAVLYPRRPIACHVELIADHSFAGRYNYDTNIIANEMHLQLMKANEIYQHTDFNQDGLLEGITLRTASIIIFKDSNATGYTYSDLRLTPIEILHAFSTRLQNHCLAFTFLYRDFSIFPKYSGTLGLAWLATDTNHAGICSQPALNPQISSNNIIVSNVGLLTTWFRGKERPRAEVAQTLAHEIGHLFGARHDDGDDLKQVHPDWKCPSKYLMSAFASFGPTATTFTDCSKWQINAVLAAKSRCFRELKAFCGNGQVEEGEECDCGPPEMCFRMQDRCCVPNACLLREECRQEFRPPAPTEKIELQPTFPPFEQPFSPPNHIPNVPPINKPPNNVPPNNVPPNQPGIFYTENVVSFTNMHTFVPFDQPVTHPPSSPPNRFGPIHTDDYDDGFTGQPNDGKAKLLNPTKKPATFDDADDEEYGDRSFKITGSFLDQFKDLTWPQTALFVLFIIGPVLFLIWLLRDTCFNYRTQRVEKKKKSRHRKLKGHRRRLEDGLD